MSEFSEDRFFEEMEDTFDEKEITEIHDDAKVFGEFLEELGLPQLSIMLAAVSQSLGNLGEKITPKTDEGRALHSKHSALKVMIEKRKAEM